MFNNDKIPNIDSALCRCIYILEICRSSQKYIRIDVLRITTYRILVRCGVTSPSTATVHHAAVPVVTQLGLFAKGLANRTIFTCRNCSIWMALHELLSICQSSPVFRKVYIIVVFK